MKAAKHKATHAKVSKKHMNNRSKNRAVFRKNPFSRTQIIFFGIVFALIGGFFIYKSFAAWTTWLVQLDNGTCGQNLQVGSDKTASGDNTPSFYLMGNGGLSKYDAYVDGNFIGNFSSAGNGNVCITTTVPLSEGSHRFTATETQPQAGKPAISVVNGINVPYFDFSIDTVPPPVPSAPVMSGYSDSGTIGDGVTRFRNINFTGTAGASSYTVQLYAGVSGAGGSSITNGNWSITTTSLSDAIYSMTAKALDTAGNVSNPSGAASITVDGTAPTASIASPANDASVSGLVNITASASDNLSGVKSVEFQVDGVTKSTDTSAPFSYSWDTSGVTTGSHTISVIPRDIADNAGSTSTISVNVGGGGSTPKVGDINSDGLVNVTDLSIMLSSWNTTNASCDLNNDNSVNIFDLSILLSHYGT